MKREIASVLILGAITGFYALLYLACSVDKQCDDVCQKTWRIDSLIRANTSAVYVDRCQTSAFCIYVNDSVPHNLDGLVDTACMYLKNEGLQHYSVNIIGAPSRDTLLKQTCP